MEPEKTPPAPADFERADMPGGAAQTCAAGAHPLTATYYTINGRAICETCHAQFERERNARGSFVLAFVLGSAAAALGAAIYYLIALTGYEFGLVAIIVGVMVAKGVRRGAGARAGWHYRALAVLLTYLAITATYVPFVLKSDAVQSVLAASVLAFVLPGLMLAKFDNLLGLVILGIGLYEAYKLSAPPRLVLEGPFTHAPAPAAIAGQALAPPAV